MVGVDVNVEGGMAGRVVVVDARRVVIGVDELVVGAGVSGGGAGVVTVVRSGVSATVVSKGASVVLGAAVAGSGGGAGSDVVVASWPRTCAQHRSRRSAKDTMQMSLCEPV